MRKINKMEVQNECVVFARICDMLRGVRDDFAKIQRDKWQQTLYHSVCRADEREFRPAVSGNQNH